MPSTAPRARPARAAIVSLVAGAVASCGVVAIDPDDPAQPTRLDYTPPEASGLIGVRPYPQPDDVCMVIGENALTNRFLDDSRLLIGCPKHERGALADRRREGAEIVAHARHWTLLSVPLP